MTTSQSYSAGVRRALSIAGLYFAAVAPAAQFAMFHTSSPAYPHPSLVWSTFGVHAVVWICAALRRIPAPTVLASWAVVGATIGMQMVAAGVAEPVAPRNIALTIAATAALVLPLRAALAASALVSLVTAVALLVTAQTPTETLWGIAVQTPIYAISVAAALGLAFRELRRIAHQADDQARAGLEADRTVQRKALEAEAARRRSRMVHDTIVNTLGAIATARIASSDRLVAQRCAEDVQMTDVLGRSATPLHPSMDAVLAHAGALDVDLESEGLAQLEQHLSSEPSWRRREIVAILRETVTNVAKHAGVTQARLHYDARTYTVTVSDDGTGMTDVASLSGSLKTRADDARARVQITSGPDRGTAVELSIPPLNDSPRGIFEAASARMATSIVAVMLTEFTVIGVVVLAFGGDWSSSAVTPPLLMWLVVAAVLMALLKNAGRARTLPFGVVAATYAAIVVMAIIYYLADDAGGVCGIKPPLAWSGDAVATIGAILVLVDGRARVVLPAVGLSATTVMLALSGTGSDCVGTTMGLFATDLLVIGAFYVLRYQTLRLSKVAAAHYDNQIRRREELERLAAEKALDDDGFAATLEFSRGILQAVAEYPARAHEPRIRDAARLEESYLRALIGLPSEVVAASSKQSFVTAIDAARAAGVGISVHASPGVLDDNSAGLIVSVVHDIITRSRRGDEVSIGVFGSRAEPSVIIVASPHAVTGHLPGQRSDAEVTVTAELGLVEMRWFDGAHRSGR
ncbi:MAG: hypothetical protein WBB07_18080 [Mycobacterium sp.]